MNTTGVAVMRSVPHDTLVIHALATLAERTLEGVLRRVVHVPSETGRGWHPSLVLSIFAINRA